MRSAIGRAVLLAAAWWALTDGEGWLFGAAAVAAALAASLWLMPPSGRRLRPAGAIRFAAFFARESLLGGVDVALRALATRPADRTRGTSLEHRTSLPAGVPRSLFVGTLGLLPGTVAVEAYGAQIHVHVIDRDLARSELIEALERRIAMAFHEPEGR